MNKTLEKFGFATVTSEGYIDQTAGLILNLRRFYPNIPIAICTLDKSAHTAFNSSDDPHLIVVTAEVVWGQAFWRNIIARMNRPELAFATKSALCDWFLNNHVTSLFLLDSDLLFLEPIDDLVSLLDSHPVVLVTSRHGIDEWDKSGRFGLFSAGIVGLTYNISLEIRKWKSACFDNCSAVPLSGTYYEQKYLDTFINIPRVALIHDLGINISQTFLKAMAPYQDSEQRWRVKDGTAIRIFHASRATDKGFPLYQKKELLNQEGLKVLSIATLDFTPRETLGSELNMAKIARRISIGRIWTNILNTVPYLSRKTMTLYRTCTLGELSLLDRFKETFIRKKTLLIRLQSQIIEAQTPSTDD